MPTAADERLDDMRAVIDATAPVAREMGLQRFFEAMVTVAKVAAAENADTPVDYAEGTGRLLGNPTPAAST